MNDSVAPQDFRKYAEEGAYHWNQLRPSYKTTFNPYLHARYELTLKYMPPAPAGAKAADLGCGDGYVCSRMIGKGYTVEGVDGSEAAISLANGIFAKQFSPASFRLQVGNVMATGLADSSVDLVTNLDVIEHLDQPELLLKEIVRIGKPGATALIGTPVRFTERPLDRYHVQEFYPEEFRALLGKHLEVSQVILSHPVEWFGIMYKTYRVLGRQKSLGWNLINSIFLLTGKNPLASENPRFPTYQLALCKVRK